MAKILRVKVKREKIPLGGTHYVYPPGYDAEKIEVLCYESVGDEPTVFARGKYNHEFCIGIVKDEDAPQFIASLDIVEITKEAAIIDGSKWRPQIEKVNDPDKVMGILARQARGIELTQKDLDALDPDHSERGIIKSESFDKFLERCL